MNFPRAPRVLLALALFISAVAAAQIATDSSKAQFRDDTVLVGFHKDVARVQQLLVVHAVGAAEARIIGADVHVLTVPPGHVMAVVDALRKYPEVRYAEPDFIQTLSGAPNDPIFPLQWGFQNTGQIVQNTPGTAGADERAVAAWNVTTGNKSVVVGIADTGIRYDHPDLAPNVWSNPGGINGCPAGTHGYDVTASVCDPMDTDTSYSGHGSHVSGIIGAATNNGVGVAGLNWQSTLLAVKWVTDTSGFTSDLISALQWMINAKQAGVNIRVVNDSPTWPGTASSQALSDEIDLLGANDILFVTAAGNTAQNNDTTPRYPCSYNRPNEICVAASDQSDQLWSNSNWGLNTVQLAAPGTNIYSTLDTLSYGTISGTSMSAAQVSGTAALILSLGYKSVSDLRTTILNAVDVLPAFVGVTSTGGRLNVCKAIPGCSSAPVNQSLPAITGSAVQGQTLTTSTGTWAGSPASYGYQWIRCDTSGVNCAAISGATTNTYVLAAADVGSTMRATVTATNTYGSTSATSAPTAVVTSGTSGGGSALLQSAAIEGSGVGSVAVSFPHSNTAGNLIIAFVRMSTTSQTVTLSDSAGNTYVDAVSQAQTTDGHQIHLFYAANIKGSSNTVTARFSSTNNHPWLAIYEYSGLSTTAPLDKTARAQGSTSSVSTGLTATTTTANELVFAGLGMVNATTVTVTPGGGYTLLLQDTNTSRAANEAQTATTTGQFAGTFTLSGTTNWSALVATFTPAGSVSAPSITTSSLPGGEVNVGYSATLQATGGTTPYAWSIITGTLPAGLTLNSGTGAITGTPTAAGASSFTVQVTDANSQTATNALSIAVNAAPTVTTTSLPNGTVGTPYSATLQASGGMTPYAWSIITGALPAGLTLNSGTGAIAGTPTAAGASNFTVQVTDANAQTATQALSISINPATIGGIGLVQSAAVQGTQVASMSSSFAAANTAGNLIIAFVRMSTTTQTVTVTDTAGNTYADAVSQVQATDGHQVHIFYAANIKGGANTVTATFSTTNKHPWLAIYEYAGLSALDQTAHAQGSGSVVSTGLTSTTGSATELVFAGLGMVNNTKVTVTPGSGYAMLLQNAATSRAANESQAAMATGTFAGTFTLSGSTNWSAVVATFK